MFGRLRTLVMWLLLFALPLQGYAVAAMAVCGAGDGHEHRPVARQSESFEHGHRHAHAPDHPSDRHVATHPTTHPTMHTMTMAGAHLADHTAGDHGAPHAAAYINTVADADVDANAADAGAAAAPLHAIHKASKAKCSVCASCCAGAALPSAVFTMASVEPATASAVSFPSLHVDFLSDGLYIPPRPLHP